MPRNSRPGRKRGGRRSSYGHKWAVCPATRKVRFRDRDTATKALAEARRAAAKLITLGVPTKRHETRAYRCPHCSGWHLTSKKERRTDGDQRGEPSA